MLCCVCAAVTKQPPVQNEVWEPSGNIHDLCESCSSGGEGHGVVVTRASAVVTDRSLFLKMFFSKQVHTEILYISA